jgi:signal peptidase II
MLDRRIVAAVAGAIALAVDQLTKSWAVGTLWMQAELQPIPGWLHLRLHFNRGLAFGQADTLPRVVVALPALAVAAWIVWMMRRTPHRSAWAFGGLALGGALGNLSDRFLRQVPSFSAEPVHAVVDFLVVFPGRWPAFNVADLAILVGLVGLVVVRQRARAASPG